MNLYPFELNAYVLMNTHVHLMVTTRGSITLDKVMHHIQMTFAKRFNFSKGRKAHFWRERYKSFVIENDSYGIACLRYIHRNPMRAHIVPKPEDWPWSSYRYYALGESNDLIAPFPSYLGIDGNPVIRREKFRKFVELDHGNDSGEKRLFSSKIKGGSRSYLNLYERCLLPLLRNTLIS